MNKIKAAWIMCFLAMALAVQSASASGIIWYTDMVVPEHITGAIEDAITANPPASNCEGYAITSWDVIEPGKELTASVACLVNVPADGKWHVEDNMAWGGTYNIKFTSAMNNLGFEAFLYDPAPLQTQIDYIVKAERTQNALEAKDEMDVAGAMALADVNEADSYGAIFPMLKGTEFYYGRLGVHDSDWADVFGNNKAIDMMTDGDTLAGHAPNQVYAAVAGEVTYVCVDGTSIAAIIGPYLYAHLDPLTDISKGKVYNIGDPIGILVKGEFDDNCGYAEQDDNWSHLHWGFPVGADGSGSYKFYVENWTLDVYSDTFTKGSQTKNPEEWIPIAWDATTNPPEWISNTEVNFWDIMFDASDIAIVAFGGNLPLYTSTFSTSMAGFVQKALTVTYILIGSLFDMKWPLVSVTIVILGEITRLIIGGYKLIKSLVPLVG